MRYTSDLTQSEWDLISYCFPKASSFGRPRKYPYLEIFNGILYINKTGCQWRNPPKDLPPWASVYHYYRTWTRSALLPQIHDHLREYVRLQSGKKRKPLSGHAAGGSMSKRKQLNLYIRQVQQRLRLDAGLRGAAVGASTALAATGNLNR